MYMWACMVSRSRPSIDNGRLTGMSGPVAAEGVSWTLSLGP